MKNLLDLDAYLFMQTKIRLKNTVFILILHHSFPNLSMNVSNVFCIVWNDNQSFLFVLFFLQNQSKIFHYLYFPIHTITKFLSIIMLDHEFEKPEEKSQL